MAVCVHAYPDAGKTCRDGSECQGDCMSTEFDSAWNDPRLIGTEKSGHCQMDDAQFGCFAIVENGRVSHAYCED